MQVSIPGACPEFAIRKSDNYLKTQFQIWERPGGGSERAIHRRCIGCELRIPRREYMRNLTWFLALFLTLLLGVTACAPALTPIVSAPEIQPTIVPTVIIPTATTPPTTYKGSVPAVLWGEKNDEHRL